MDFFNMLTIILSHIVGALYMQKQKYNKLLTACFWGAYAIFAVCVMLFLENIVFGFFSLLLMQVVVFFITSEGSVGERIFLLLTYANSFCIFLGARLVLFAFLGENAYLQLYATIILILIHLFLYKVLIPSYKKSEMFFGSGWWKLNIVLIFFMIQFVNQYAFAGFDRNSVGLIVDFIIFSIIFYSTLIIIFDTVKNTASKNRKALENAELEKIAYIDTLTNIQSRVAYMKFTKEQALFHRNNMTNSSFVFVMMDIDGFKRINDTKGHVVGDETLKCVGDVINDHFKDFECKSFRIGGDEFVLLFENKSKADVENYIRKMNEKLYSLNGITISYGCCDVDFGNEKPFEQAYKKADKLMYSDKKQKKIKV